MKKITSLIASVLLVVTVVSAQETSLEKAYQEYFKLPREGLFLHTNKTTYLTGEEIWLKAYAFDKKNSLPSQLTRNIYIGLYDSVGKQIDKKLFLGKQGHAIGNIRIDSTLVSGSYYLKASTNWMKNFKEDDAYVQKIQILNSKKINAGSVNKNKFDLQFLPEGGHMLLGVKNTIGLKFLNDEGKGGLVSGTIYDQQNNAVANFSSNILGMGKFSLTPEVGKTYTAKFVLDNDNEEKVVLPEAKPTGIAMSVDNMRKDKFIVSLRTNQKTYEKLGASAYKLLIHRDGLLKGIQIQMDGLVKSFPIAKKELFPGLNIITLVNAENKPIAERMIFNDVGFEKIPLAISEVSSDFDSINYTLRSIKPLQESETVSLSVSVLPAQTKSYNPNNNIISALLVQPYIKTLIEKPNFYFKNFGLKDRYELDILLLTQGWSRYAWNNILDQQPKPLYDFENGISVNGAVNSNLRNVKSFIVYPTKNNGSMFLNADAKGKFVFKNFFPERGEEISFSAVMKNGKMKRPLINLSPIILNGKDALANNQLSSDFRSYYADKNDIPKNFIGSDIEQLDEVTVVVKKKERLRDPQFPNAEITQITEEIARSYPNITDYIQNNGFDVVDGTTSGVFLGRITITSRGRGGGASPVLFINGALIQDYNILQTITMDKVDKILIDRSGIGLGISGGNAFGGVIKITTRATSLFSPNLASPDIFKTKINYGFEPTKEFYAPKYPSYRISSFKNYGVVHWDPNVSLSGSESYKFRTVNTELEDLNFYIEGISNKGTFFSQIIRWDSTKKASN